VSAKKQNQPRHEQITTQAEGQNIIGLDYQRLEKYAEELVRGRLVKISMTKMRRLHQEIARIREMSRVSGGLNECEKAFIHLKYLLAYTYGRLEKGKEREYFKEYMDTLKKTINSILQDPQRLKENVERLYTFSEAIIAYHKYYEELEKEESRRERG
jgi:CRISPR type III-A-associated protein Csm2